MVVVDVRVLVWAGAPVPVFHPTRGEVRKAVRTLTRATRIRCQPDPREHPFSHRPSWTMDERMHDRSDFTPLRSESFPHEQQVTAAGLVDIVASMSFIAALAPDARAAALADVAAVLQRHGAEDLALFAEVAAGRLSTDELRERVLSRYRR